MTDQTAERRTGRIGERLRHRVLVFRLPHLHLDQLMVGERRIDGLNDAVVDAPLADLDDGLERMRQSPQLTAVTGREWQRRHGRTVAEDRPQVQGYELTR